MKGDLTQFALSTSIDSSELLNNTCITFGLTDVSICNRSDQMLAKKTNITSRAECFDYEAFAPQLQRNPCI